MRKLKCLSIFVALVASMAANATGVYSSCQNVIGIENAMPGSNVVIVYLSPGIAGCGTGGYSFSIFQIGQNGVTVDNINGILGTATTAYVTGHQVAIEYDNSTASCFGNTISIGTSLVAGACP